MSMIAGFILTQVDSTPLFTPGLVITAQDGKKYKYVQYETALGNVAAVVGNVCYYFAPVGISGGQVTVVTSDLSDSAGVGAGVLQAVIPDGSYGWIQVRGAATLTTSLTLASDGSALTPVGATDGTLDQSALVTDHHCAVAIDASAKIIMCLFPD